MAVEIGIWLAAVGGLAALAGLTGMRRVRRLRRSGSTVWAMVVPSPVTADASPGRTRIQYELTDGRVIERICPQPARRSASLRPGQKVLIWYDPADPEEIVVAGRDGLGADRVFVATGVLFLLLGAAVAGSGH
jgi:hypothetical protein